MKETTSLRWDNEGKGGRVDGDLAPGKTIDGGW